MIYMRNITITTAKSATYLENVGWSLWNIPQSKIEYEWRYKVKNLTDTKQNISVTYELHDKNGTIVSKSNASKLAEAGETIEIKEIGHIEYGDAQRITDASWSIGRHAIP